MSDNDELKIEKGKRLALERELAALRRENDRIAAEAAALEEQAMATIATAIDQIKIALAINTFFYRLARWAHADAIETVTALHHLHRVGTLTDLVTALCRLAPPGHETTKQATEVLSRIGRDNLELRADLEKQAQQLFRSKSERVFAELIQLVESGDL